MSPQSPRPIERIAQILSRVLLGKAGRFSILFFVLGIVWVLLFPLVCISTGELKCRGTYFSENAIGAGLASTSVSQEDIRLGMSIDSDYRLGTISLLKAVQKVIPDAEMHHAGAIYGVLRPLSAGDRREAVILVTRLYNLPSGNSQATSLSMTLSVVNALRKVMWLSKNVILVVASEAHQLKVWIDEYHSSETNIMRGGAIIGGLVFDFPPANPGESMIELEVWIPGHNGKLPNLDLVNTLVYYLPRMINLPFVFGSKPDDFAVRLRDISTKTHALIAQHHPVSISDVSGYLGQIHNVASFMRDTAFGGRGWHGYLLPYDIHSVTLSSKYGKFRDAIDQQFKGLGYITELMVRSMSNLVEKFHQSYFLYILPDPKKFVSIGEYFGPLMCVLAPLILFLGRTIISQGSEKNAGSFVSAFVAVIISFLWGCGVFLFEMVYVQYIPIVTTLVVPCCILTALQIYKAPIDIMVFKSLLALIMIATTVMIGMFNFPLAYGLCLLLVPLLGAICYTSHILILRVLYMLILLISVHVYWLMPMIFPSKSDWMESDQPMLYVSKLYPSIIVSYITLIYLPLHALSSTILVLETVSNKKL